MKKTLLAVAMIAALGLVQSINLNAQSNFAVPGITTSDDEEETPVVSLKVIPLAEYSFTGAKGEENGTEWSHGFGTNSIYTFLNLSFSENFTWTVGAHLFEYEDGTKLFDASKSLYDYKSGYNNGYNWLQYFYGEYTLGDWTFGLGKDLVLTGGSEMEDWDHEAHWSLNSSFWNAMPVYQWGARVGYTIPAGTHSFTAQITASPYCERPFASGLWNYALQWNTEYDLFSTKVNANATQKESGAFDYTFAAGGTFNVLDNLSIGVDWMNKAGIEYETDEDWGYVLPGNTAMATINWSPSDKWDLMGRFIYEGYDFDGEFTSLPRGGVSAHFFPINNSRALRLHATAAYGDYAGGFHATFGAFIELSLLRITRK